MAAESRLSEGGWSTTARRAPCAPPFKSSPVQNEASAFLYISQMSRYLQGGRGARKVRSLATALRKQRSVAGGRAVAAVPDSKERAPDRAHWIGNMTKRSLFSISRGSSMSARARGRFH